MEGDKRTAYETLASSGYKMIWQDVLANKGWKVSCWDRESMDEYCELPRKVLLMQISEKVALIIRPVDDIEYTNIIGGS